MEVPSDALGAALFLAATYALGGPLFARGAAAGIWERRLWVSAAAGVSVAYVFVDVLPELAAQRQIFLDSAGHRIAFAEQRIYVLALLAFVILYGLEHIVLASRERLRDAAVAGVGGPVYWLHL